MKAWVLAVGLSLGLHGGLVLMFRGEEVVVVPAQSRVGDGFVNFTPVVAPAAPVAVAPVVPKVVRARPGADLGMAPVVAEEGPAIARGLLQELPLPPGGEGIEGVDEVSEGNPGPHPDPPPKGEGDAVDVVALVHSRLAAMAEGCYPAAARRFQQRGTVQLSFCLDASGGAASTSITQSSGAALLDAAAQGCVVQKAAPFPPEAASRCFSVPVRFGAR
ncbi:MAG: energy transducer TonB [Archangium sp.]|nr:energy transducer TonB [Archangium sp.]